MTMERATTDFYALFAEFYDHEYASVDGDLEFYRGFAEQAGGPILELGCGSGRVLAHLVDTGLELTGVDNSPAMLAIARERLPAAVSLVEADMERIAESPVLQRDHYWMAFSAINTFLHLQDVEAQLATLEGLRTLVVSGGLLLLDVMQPDPAYLAQLDGRLFMEFSTILPSGERLDKFVSRTHDLADQTIDTTVYFDITHPMTGALTRRKDSYLTRYVHRFELEHLCARAGWEIISWFGDYDLSDYTSDSERMLVLATWH